MTDRQSKQVCFFSSDLLVLKDRTGKAMRALMEIEQPGIERYAVGGTLLLTFAQFRGEIYRIFYSLKL